MEHSQNNEGGLNTMKLTTNYGLKKPEGTDTVNIDDLNDNADILDTKLKALDVEVTETKKSVSDGKLLIAAAITLQGVATAATDTFARMAANIKAIITGAGNAIASVVLEGYTFTNATGVETSGTMKHLTNRATITHATDNATRVIPGDAAFMLTNSDGVHRVEIRYNGEQGFVTPNTLFAIATGTMATAGGLTAVKLLAGQGAFGLSGTATNDATATAERLLYPNTAYVKGSKVTGTMPDNTTLSSNGTVPGISSSYPNVPSRTADNYSPQINTNTDGVKRISMCPPKGYYQGNAASYISRPASEFGNAATNQVLSGATFTSENGLKVSGTMANLINQSITLTASDKRPVIVGAEVWQTTNSDGTTRVCIRGGKAGYIDNNIIFAAPQTSIASILGITATKIVTGNTICGVAGTRKYADEYAHADWWTGTLSFSSTEQSVSIGTDTSSGWIQFEVLSYSTTYSIGQGNSIFLPVGKPSGHSGYFINWNSSSNVYWVAIDRASNGACTLRYRRINGSSASIPIVVRRIINTNADINGW